MNLANKSESFRIQIDYNPNDNSGISRVRAKIDDTLIFIAHGEFIT